MASDAACRPCGGARRLARLRGDRWISSDRAVEPSGGFTRCLDGIFGFQFRPPVPPEVAALFTHVDTLPIRLRAAIDLPSGLSENTQRGDPVFRADFTYATGCVKAPLIN